ERQLRCGCDVSAEVDAAQLPGREVDQDYSPCTEGSSPVHKETNRQEKQIRERDREQSAQPQRGGQRYLQGGVGDCAKAAEYDKQTAEGGYDVKLWRAKGSTAFSKDAATTSEEVKKEFREAVLKSAEEYKRDRTIEINTAESKDVEAEESGEISNPNDEIPVT